MKKIIILTLVFTSFLNALVCNYTQKNDLKVYYEGFKTDFKIGVNGEFKKLKYTPAKLKAATMAELLIGSTVVIDGYSAKTATQEINDNIKNYFFKKLISKKIKGKIVGHKLSKKYNRGSFDIELTFNNITKTITMDYYLKKDMLYANGNINLVDFEATDAVDSLNKACTVQHLGKTWYDANINFSLALKKECKY